MSPIDSDMHIQLLVNESQPFPQVSILWTRLAWEGEVSGDLATFQDELVFDVDLQVDHVKRLLSLISFALGDSEVPWPEDAC